MRDLAERLPREEIFQRGHPLCPGCSGGILWRLTGKVLGKNSICTVSASCLALPSHVYPVSLTTPSLYLSMSTAPAGITGMSAALKVLRRKGRLKDKERIHIYAISGDGSAADIGMACLSGAAERNDDGIFICFDNEAYMNTGIQRSSCTPFGSWTTTTLQGKTETKKDLPEIMVAHHIPYVATASIAFPDDYVNKLEQARDMEAGFKYIHVHSPCPTGWRFPERKTVEVARLAVESGIWILYQVLYGQFRLTYRPIMRRSVRDYLKMQGRFSHLTEMDIQKLQILVDERWQSLIDAESLKQNRDAKR